MTSLLKLAGIARSTYYYLLKQMNSPDPDASLKAEIKAIDNEHQGRYGYRRIRGELKNRGIKVNHKKGQRIMQERFKKHRPYKEI
ncbi:transposase InsO family protein [Cytobacillus purgationiresistens]|uniref:Transposase InsO family protein n=1 Tax=Cytobacillus purgationiresistens TaxID=863449 RepID=A0ABU0AC68_9BACI|nr:transposase InsO family protein [Cytobacillus purgationiresistens]